MNSKRMIYLVYDCDEWKSSDSMRLCMATTSQRRLKSFIAQKIKRGVYYYGDSSVSEIKQADMFRRDFDSLTAYEICGRLEYGYYEYTHDGEEI